MQQLVAAFARSFVNGDRFETITSARSLAESILNEKITPGTPNAKFVDEAIEQGLIQAARHIVERVTDPIQAWEQCLDLYDRQPGLNTRTSTSVLQQAYSTPVPIAYLAGQLAGINKETTVYEPTAGNGALLLLASPDKAVVNELNPNRAAALRAQGFTVTQQDASTFLPGIEAVDRIITNPPFGSLKDTQGLTQTFRRGLLTTSQLDHAIALTALDLMKSQGRAVLILGGKMGDERSRTERYNTQLTRGFYRWLYKDAGYKVSDHFSISGSLYRKQGTSFPIDVIVIEGKGETQLKLPGVEPPRRYESYEALKEVLIYAAQQQPSFEQNRHSGITLRGIYSGSSLDTNVSDISRSTLGLDNSIDSSAIEPNRERGGILNTPDEALGVVDTGMDRRLDAQLRPPGGWGDQIVDSTGDRTISSSTSAIPQSPSNAQRDGILLNNELLGLATGSFEQPTVSRDSTAEVGAEFESFGRHESDGLVGLDEHRRKPTQLSRLNNMADLLQTPDVDVSQVQDVEERVIYRSRSKANSLSTLAPAASLKGLENAFNKIEATTGLTIDEYVRDRLNESSLDELFKHYAAEQIDSLALAIYNHEYETKATLVGHDTGIGKSRIICGLARYAQQQGLTPVIVTVDPVLYGDLLVRDARDTGNNFNPFITNNKLSLALTGSNGDVIGTINTPDNQIEKVRQYAQSGNIGEHDCVFTTYGQLTGSASVERRQLLNVIAPRSFLILDESHKAGGAAGEQRPKTLAEKAKEQSESHVSSCTEFFQQLVTRTQGFVASSATAIKDPIIASRLFYETTDLRLAAPDKDTFTEHLKAGGVPLQQMVFAMWAESGGCIRCEKSYEGVEFGVAKVPVSLQTAENNSKILNLIWRFDRIKENVVQKISADFAEAGEAAQLKNPALGEAGATSTIFTSVLHNLTAVTALGLKAEETANSAIADIEQGRKPIIMLFNTLESATKNFVEAHNELVETHNTAFPDSPMKRIEVGDAISINAGELFTRYLEKSRTIKITEPYLDELTGKQVTRSYRLTDIELGEEAVAAFNRAEAAIASADWTKLPISPIDYIKQKIEDAGHSIGEITGRTNVLKYESAQDLGAGVVIYGTREHGTAQKKQVMDDFQNGLVDAVITNSTTGYSLHASRTVADQRQRVMYIVQPHLDVNQVEQSIGRSHRSGQVDPKKHAPDRLDEQGRPQWGQYAGTFGLPIFKLVVGQDLPTEERAVAILMKKMSHLKANTTGNRSSSFGLIEMPDFINDYGNEVAQNLMEQYPDLHADLDYPLGHSEELGDPKAAIQKVTGRAVILTSDEPPTPSNPYPSLARQAGLYDTLTTEYKEFLTQKIALGENELEAQKLDLQAQPVSRLVLNPGAPETDSPFTKPAYLVEVQAKTGAKPNTTLQVVNAIRSQLGFEAIADLVDHDDFERSDVRLKGRDLAQETVDNLRESVGEFLDTYTKTKEAEIDSVRGRMEKYQQRLDALSAISSDLTLAKTEAVARANIPLADQLTSQLAQQQPKIDKLRTQVSKTQLDLNGKEYQLARDGRITKANCEDICELIEQFPVGQGIRFIDTTTKNFLYGVVAGVEQKGRANNPASPSNWKIKLLVVDGVRSLSVRLDSLLKDKKQLLEPVETAFSYTRPQQESSIYELFDERQTEAKEKRYLVSGQVLAAQLTGKFAQVTDHEGQVHPVYLLRRGFDPAQDLNIKPVKLETLKDIKQFLFEATGSLGVVQTENQNLTIIADIRQGNAGGIVLKTPKATSQGGLYFKDEGLLGLTGDFGSKTESVRERNNTKSQSIMTVTVEAEKTDTVLSYVSGKWGLGAASHKNVARELLGQVLPSWEPCTAINPDVERVVAVDRPPQSPTSNRNHLERAFDASNVSKDSAKGDLLNVEPNNLDGGSTTKQNYSQSIEHNSPSSSTLTEPNSLPIPPAATIAIPLDVHTAQSDKQIAEPALQHGSAEKNVAKLLHQAGLATSILEGEDFYLKVENEPYIPLSIERQGQELYLTHFLKDRSGELFIDAEMVFNISQNGQLSLTETAIQNPLTGGEYRRNDQQFGKTFSKNLLDQGFASAANAAIRAIEQSKSPKELAQDSINAAATIQPPHLVQVESLDTAKAEVHPSTQYLLQLEPTGNSPKPKPAATKTKQAKIPSHKEYQLHKPVGVQLNLFDVGLGSPRTDLEPMPQPKIRIKDVSPDIEKNATVETLNSISTVSEQPFTSLPVQQDIAHNTAELSSDLLSTPMQIFQQVVDRVDKRTGDFLSGLQSSSPTLTTLRDWYRAARELGNNQNYLNRITEVANEFKQGKLLPDKAIKVMQADLQLHHKQLTTTDLVSQLSDRDFLQLHQGLADHFKEAPPHPPAVADRQFVQGEVEQLQAQINHLWQKQTQQAEIVEAMQKNPFRIWNSKYDAAVSQVQATTGLISQSITQKEQKEQQLKQWEKLDEVHQAWDKSPQTSQMRSLASVLNSPPMQERLSNIKQQQRQQEQLPKPGLQPYPKQRGSGLSL